MTYLFIKNVIFSYMANKNDYTKCWCIMFEGNPDETSESIPSPLDK